MVLSLSSSQVRSQVSISIIGGGAGEEAEKRGRTWRIDYAWDK